MGSNSLGGIPNGEYIACSETGDIMPVSIQFGEMYVTGIKNTFPVVAAVQDMLRPNYWTVQYRRREKVCLMTVREASE
jgi:hypothetical protein